VFSVLSVPKCYKQDCWNDKLFVRESPVSKNVSKEAENIIEIVIRQRLVKAAENLVYPVVKCRASDLVMTL
jgi:hypothetical protein